MKLNLGCGQNALDGYINVDREFASNADYKWNLEEVPWPWVDSSASEILMSHSLEHIGQSTTIFLRVMKELYRILEPNGKLILRVPHHHNDSFWNDPTHVRPITPEMMQLFSRRNCDDYARNKWPNTPLALYLDVNFELLDTDFRLMPYWGRKYRDGELTKPELDNAMATLWNVVDEVTMTLVKLE